VPTIRRIAESANSAGYAPLGHPRRTKRATQARAMMVVMMLKAISVEYPANRMR